MNNDVLASLEMMLTFGQMMLCLSAQMKKSKSFDLDFFGWGTGIRTPEMSESESDALPLGDAPIFSTDGIIADIVSFVKGFFEKS